MVKWLVRTIYGIVGLCAIGLCVGIWVRYPDTYRRLFGIKTDEDTTSTVPYLMNFPDAKGLASGTESFQEGWIAYGEGEGARSWYGSGVCMEIMGDVTPSIRLGWDAGDRVGMSSSYMDLTGIRTYIQGVRDKALKEANETGEEIDESKIKSSYMLMDFDFEGSHYACMNYFSVCDGTTKNLFLDPYNLIALDLIVSHDSGASWTKASDAYLLDGERDTLTNQPNKEIPGRLESTVNTLTGQKTRYGLVLVGTEEIAYVNMTTFYAKRISQAS